MWRVRRKPDHRMAACRDIAGRHREVLVLPTDNGRIALVLPPGEVAVLEPLQAGRLRAAIRDTLLALDGPRDARGAPVRVPTARATA